MLYGRYPGDHYYNGNPWFLISAALGELFYRGASITGLNGLADDEVINQYIQLIIYRWQLGGTSLKWMNPMEFKMFRMP